MAAQSPSPVPATSPASRTHFRIILQTESQSSEVPQLLVPEVWYQSLHYRVSTRGAVLTCFVKLATPTVPPAVRGHLYSSVQSYSQPALHRILLPLWDMENRIKEQQLDLFSDRTSTHEFDSNQLRLWFSSLAYVLLQLRQHCLTPDGTGYGSGGTIRTQLLKLGPNRMSARVHIAISSACPPVVVRARTPTVNGLCHSS